MRESKELGKRTMGDFHVDPVHAKGKPGVMPSVPELAAMKNWEWATVKHDGSDLS